MTLLEISVVVSAAVVVLARWTPPRARRAVTSAAVAAFVLCGAALVPAGVRWQLLPVLAGGSLAAPFAVSPLLRRRPGRPAWRARWWLAAPGTAACAGLVAAGVAAAWALPRPVFPEPSGPYAVGTSVLRWTDPDRPETATAEPGDRRTVVVQLWYPARPSPAGVDRARYLGRTDREARAVARGLTGYLGVPGFLLDEAPQARSHAVFDAPAAGGGRWPVVLFSPGLGGVRTQNTAWAE
jgi:predicted dienelactone hydrolase